MFVTRYGPSSAPTRCPVQAAPAATANSPRLAARRSSSSATSWHARSCSASARLEQRRWLRHPNPQAGRLTSPIVQRRPRASLRAWLAGTVRDVAESCAGAPHYRRGHRPATRTRRRGGFVIGGGREGFVDARRAHRRLRRSRPEAAAPDTCSRRLRRVIAAERSERTQHSISSKSIISSATSGSTPSDSRRRRSSPFQGPALRRDLRVEYISRVPTRTGARAPELPARACDRRTSVDRRAVVPRPAPSSRHYGSSWPSPIATSASGGHPPPVIAPATPSRQRRARRRPAGSHRRSEPPQPRPPTGHGRRRRTRSLRQNRPRHPDRRRRVRLVDCGLHSPAARASIRTISLVTPDSSTTTTVTGTDVAFASPTAASIISRDA